MWDLLVTVPDLVPKGQKTACDTIALQGGVPAGNAAYGQAVLGHDTGFPGYFGNNPLSDVARSELLRCGVSDWLFV